MRSVMLAGGGLHTNSASLVHVVVMSDSRKVYCVCRDKAPTPAAESIVSGRASPPALLFAEERFLVDSASCVTTATTAAALPLLIGDAALVARLDSLLRLSVI